MPNEPKKSKYLRDKNEEQTSKYIRTGKDKNESKYLKKNNESSERNAQHSKYIKNANTVPSYYSKMKMTAPGVDDEEETLLEETVPETTETVEEEAPQEMERIERKGDSKGLFSETKAKKTDARSYAQIEVHKSTREERKSTAIRMVICTAVLTVVAVIFQQAPFRLPILPSMLSIDLSTFPEFVIAIAYGPLYGLAVIILKNLVYVLMVDNAYISALTNIVVDTCFVFIGGLLYTRSMHGERRMNLEKMPKDKRRTKIFLSGLAATLIAGLPAFVATRFIAYPLLMRFYEKYGYTEGAIISNYEAAFQKVMAILPAPFNGIFSGVYTLTRGILMFNVPVIMFKLFLVTVITTLLYRYISPFMHYRKRPKKDK